MQLKLTNFICNGSVTRPLTFFQSKKQLAFETQFKRTANSTTDNPKVTINNMTISNIRMALSWAEKEKWNPGKHEAQALYSADPKGYFILKENNNPVATLAAVRYNQNYGFLGLYMVKKEYRGRGYGIQLWNSAFEHIKDCSCIGLNAVLNQVNNYQKFGFNTYAINTRWAGIPNSKQIDFSVSTTLNSLISAEEICNYDQSILPINRKSFLKKWLIMPNASVLAAVVDGNIQGYGVISKCFEGYKVAPLYANNFAVAKEVFAGLSKLVGKGKSIQLDTIDSNPHATELAKNFGLFKTSTTVQMYRGETPQIDNEKIYGLTSLEIG